MSGKFLYDNEDDYMIDELFVASPQAKFTTKTKSKKKASNIMQNLSIPELVKSKRFWVLVISLIAYVLKSELDLTIDVESWSNIALAVIAGYSIEDCITAWNDGKPSPFGQLVDAISTIPDNNEPPANG